MKKSFKKIPFALTLMAAAVSSAAWATEPTPVEVTQNVTNEGLVTNTTPSIKGTAELSLGTASSAAASATGAVASVSVSSIDANLPNPAGNFGTIGQAVNNTGDVKNGTDTKAAIVNLGSGGLDTAASISSSSSGAVASVAISAVTTTDVAGTAPAPNTGLPVDVPTISGITQGTFTAGGTVDVPIKNTGDIYNYATVTTTGDLGIGASASISATGAVASVSIRGVSDTTNSVLPADFTGSSVGAIGQAVKNEGTITNVGYAATLVDPEPVDKSYALSVGNLGTGASASISASGAVAAVSTSMVNANLATMTYSTVNQNVENTGSVSNTAMVDGLNVGNLGTGASASISATGAVASVSTAMINGDLTALKFGNVDQIVNNTGSSGTVENSGSLNAGNLGAGASASVSASGAVASVSVVGTSSGTSATFAVPEFGNIDQNATNSMGITNTGLSVNVGTLGQGASASISSTGAVTSVSVTSNNEIATAGKFGTVDQVATNGEVDSTTAGKIQNTGGITAGASIGIGASLSVSATGAVASVSVSSIVDSGALPTATTFGTINQTANNYGSVSNTGTISFTTATLSTGASASVSATGAVNSVSFKTVQ